MKFIGKVFFMAVDARPGRKDPAQMVYQAGVMSGIESASFYIDKEKYDALSTVPQFSPMEVEVNYDPVRSRIYLENFRVQKS